MRYEYLALPAPNSTKSVKGQKTPAERLAHAVTEMINELAEDEWEYVRSDTLTITDKAHRLAKVTERIETVLIFRREWQEIPKRHQRESEVQAAPAVSQEPVRPAAQAQPAPAPEAEPLITPPPRRRESEAPRDTEFQREFVRDVERPVAPSTPPAQNNRADDARFEAPRKERPENSQNDTETPRPLGGIRRD